MSFVQASSAVPVQPPEHDFTELKKNPLWFYIKKNKRSFTLGMVFLVLTNSLDGVYPLLIKRAVDLVADKAPFGDISKTAVLFFVVMALLAVTRYIWRVNFGKYHTDAAEDLRNRIFVHLTSMGPNFFKKNPVGELLSVIINDVQSFRNAIGNGVLVLADGVIIVCITLPIMVWLNAGWTWKTLILLPLVPFLIRKITQAIFSTFKIQQDRLAGLSGVSQELVAGIRVIKSFAQEKNRLKMYNVSSESYEESCNKTAFWDSMFSPVMEFGVASGSVILLFIAGGDVISGAASIGTLVAFQRYIGKMTWPMTALGLGFSQYQKGMASFERICELTVQKTDIPDHGTSGIETFATLEVKNLSYQFEDAQTPVLNNLHFTIHSGQMVGIVGPVGSGKTTLVHLLARLYPAAANTVLINGISVESISQESLRKTISLVPQEAFLFSDSIAENMGFGLNALPTEMDLQKWAKAVDIDHEITSQPSGFLTQLGEKGVNLSGGQKQRLSIARALMISAPILILDDSLSAVDTKTEANIKASIESLHEQRKTLIIVAHRLGSVENADQIIVLNHGEIEAIGTHKELQKTSPTYRSMAQAQGYSVGVAGA